MRISRLCTKTGCGQEAVATLTYVYADATAVLGPLATEASPNAYDLCKKHAQNLTVPRGWDVVRLVTEFVPAEPNEEDLEALANVVRQASQRKPVSADTRGVTWDGRYERPSAPPSTTPKSPRLKIVPNPEEN